ncbi:MAG: hypothetical protein JO235_26970 [Chroococcidiopsidaceae cyanobacterium CP_BM_RX_35]|nr:hypothetical protein [Chroococcidiopsidaceae cyanobacterium CP_BM_RX_35]
MEAQVPWPDNSPMPCLELEQIQGPVIEFGIEGANHPSQTVMILSNGQIIAEGRTDVRAKPLSPLTVKALVQLANAENFWILPEFTGEKFSTKFPSVFVSIQLACACRHVAARGSASSGPFAELYALLQDIVTLSIEKESDYDIDESR